MTTQHPADRPGHTTPTTPAEFAAAYFDRWRAGDADGLGALFTDATEFRGPMGVAHGSAECVRGLVAVRGMVDDIEVIRRWVDGDDAITWFEFHRAGAEPIPVVNWSHVDGGAITRIRVTFDPRPLLG